MCTFVFLDPQRFFYVFFSSSFTLSPQANRRLMEATSVHTAVHRYICTIGLHLLGMPFKPATSLAPAQSPGKAALLRLKVSSQTLCLPLKPKWGTLNLAQPQWHLSCITDVPKSWLGLQLARLVKCPGYKPKGKRQLIPSMLRPFFPPSDWTVGPTHLGTVF